jgi:hypothetical protein
MKKSILVLSLLAAIFSCTTREAAFNREDGLASFTVEGLEKHLKVLASDEYMGRMPFTEGETKTIAYLEEQFKALGLEPGNGSSYIQEVPMVEITTQADPSLQVTGPKGKFSIEGLKDYVLWTQRTDSLMEWKEKPRDRVPKAASSFTMMFRPGMVSGLCRTTGILPSCTSITGERTSTFVNPLAGCRSPRQKSFLKPPAWTGLQIFQMHVTGVSNPGR